MDKVKAALLRYANDMCLAEGSSLKAVNLVRGNDATSTLSSLQMVSPKELPKETLPSRRRVECMMKKRVRMAIDTMGLKSSLLTSRR